jgi:hypothetical protein
MKLIITESQELDVKKKFIFMLLNNKNYNLVEIGGRIYFAKNIGDNYGEIRFNKSDGWCGFSYGLVSFLSTITGFERSEVQELIGKWVEHTLQMKVKYTGNDSWAFPQKLNIPYK